jgi:hypothetical protein
MNGTTITQYRYLDTKGDGRKLRGVRRLEMHTSYGKGTRDSWRLRETTDTGETMETNRDALQRDSKGLIDTVEINGDTHHCRKNRKRHTKSMFGEQYHVKLYSCSGQSVQLLMMNMLLTYYKQTFTRNNIIIHIIITTHVE